VWLRAARSGREVLPGLMCLLIADYDSMQSAMNWLPALPIKEIVAMARARCVDAIVDSAHAWGQIDFNVRDLGFDFAGFNLHKWMGAPLGVGVLYIRKQRIADIDVFMASEEYGTEDVRARVHSGTSNFAAFLTVPVDA
jgi:isopenicillin-N epimerase